MNWKWIKTSRVVFTSIYTQHQKDLTPYATCTAPDGNLLHDYPYIMTTWGFKDADAPIIKEIATKENRQQKEYDYEYFIAKLIEGE